MKLSLHADLATVDPAIAEAIRLEAQRQEDHVELIASENYVSRAVLTAQGSVLTNKYAEGYSQKRYYGGCEFVDRAETLAIERACQLFGADYANVQPHSGSQANAAVLQALLTPGDTLLGMSLSAGGHLTHGSPVNFSGKMYQAIGYGLDPRTELIDYNALADLAKQHRPKLIIAGFSAYSRVIDWQAFREIADSVGAYLLADIAHVAGLVAVGLYPSPIPYADVVTTTTHKTLRGPRGGMILAKANPELTKKLNSAMFPGLQGGPLMHIIAAKAVALLEAMQPDFVTYQQAVLKNAKVMAEVLSERELRIVSGGTDNHLMLVDLTPAGVTGKTMETCLDLAHITVNKNTIPQEPLSPFVTSGIRLGTPAVTTRGFNAQDIRQVANVIADMVFAPDNAAVLENAKAAMLALCQRYPVYQED